MGLEGVVAVEDLEHLIALELVNRLEVGDLAHDDGKAIGEGDDLQGFLIPCDAVDQGDEVAVGVGDDGQGCGIVLDGGVGHNEC